MAEYDRRMAEYKRKMDKILYRLSRINEQLKESSTPGWREWCLSLSQSNRQELAKLNAEAGHLVDEYSSSLFPEGR